MRFWFLQTRVCFFSKKDAFSLEKKICGGGCLLAECLLVFAAGTDGYIGIAAIGKLYGGEVHV